MNDFEDVALKIVPKGHDRPRSELRELIADTLVTEIERALAKQRVDHFPELGPLQDELKRKIAETTEFCKTKSAELHKLELVMIAKEKEVSAKQDALADVLQAFNDWDQWLNGSGEVDEISKRFDKFRAAAKTYREKCK